MPAELHLFGGAALMGPDGVLIAGAAAQPRRLAVMAVLADAWPAPVTRDRLVGLLWPDQDDQGARRLLTQSLYNLRRELGDFTRASGRDVAIDADALVVDLIEFRKAMAAGDVNRAASLYRGPLLDGVHVRGAAEFERWLESVRDSTRRQFHSAVEQITAECGAAGEWREAAHWAERLVREAPYDTPAALRLIDCWVAAGDRGAALAAATSYERRMRGELGLEPDPAVRRRVREAVLVAGHAPADRAVPMPPAEASVGPLRPADDRPLEGDVGSTSRRPARSAARWLAAPLLAAALVVAMLLARTSPARSDAHVVELLPIESRGDSLQGELAIAARRVLAGNLDGIGGMRVIATDSLAGAEPWARLKVRLVSLGAEVRVEAELAGLDDGRPRSHVSTVRGPRDSLLAMMERVSIDLLPGLYPEGVAARVTPAALASFTSMAAARHVLDGETAYRRGAFDDAHGHFVAATGRDSTNPRAWYRRATSAELAHRMDDADASLAAAVANGRTLPERQRAHLAAYALWRVGDATAAEARYRALLTADGTDREAWVQLGEIMVHAGPLHGQSIDRARDPWYRVVALDSGDVTALVHGVRIAARAHDMAALEALLARAERAGAAGVPLAESRIIAAYARGDRRALAAAARMLDSVPAFSLNFLHGVVAGQLEQVDAAAGIARRMVGPSRPAAVQGQGYLALAHLAFTRGRWNDAMRALDSARVRNPVAAAWTRAYFASFPFVQLADEARAQIARDLEGVPAIGGAAPLYLQIGVAIPAAAVIRPYLGALLALASTDPREERQLAAKPAGLDCAASEPDDVVAALCSDLNRALAAEAAWHAGRAEQALGLLESLEMRTPYQYAARSQFHARSRERFLRAMLLERTGRYAEAEAWYAASVHGAWSDYVFLAPSYLGRARARAQLGDGAGAALHYRRVLDLLDAPDPEMGALRREAEAGLARLASSAR